MIKMYKWSINPQFKLTSGWADCVSCPNLSNNAIKNSFGFLKTYIGDYAHTSKQLTLSAKEPLINRPHNTLNSTHPSGLRNKYPQEDSSYHNLSLYLRVNHLKVIWQFPYYVRVFFLLQKEPFCKGRINEQQLYPLMIYNGLNWSYTPLLYKSWNANLEKKLGLFKCIIIHVVPFLIPLNCECGLRCMGISKLMSISTN